MVVVVVSGRRMDVWCVWDGWVFKVFMQRLNTYTYTHQELEHNLQCDAIVTSPSMDHIIRPRHTSS